MTVKQQPHQCSIAQEIRDKTGFILEHDVATIFEAHDWTIIHNRYYLDDVQAMQREIDLLVYKVDEVDGILVYTSLIVSCKKSENKDWIFLTRNTAGTKSNLDTSPFIYWSNSEELNYQLKDKRFIELPYCDKDILDHLNSFFDYSKTVFAFREYENNLQKTNKVANDTGIYESIITLIKSQGYELESLPVRRKNNICYYNLNLLTIADVKRFIEVECKGEDLIESEIEQINYVNRFLVNRREHNSRITFTKFSVLESVISDFDLLHKANCKIVEVAIDKFYKTEIIRDYTALKIILSKHSDELSNSIRWEIFQEYPVKNEELADPFFDFKIKSNIWEIGLEASKDLIDFLNQHEKVRGITKSWLENHLRSSASFKFIVFDLPF